MASAWTPRRPWPVQPRSAGVLAVPSDVARMRWLGARSSRARPLRRVHVLMNNAGIQPGSGMFGPAELGAVLASISGASSTARRCSHPACRAGEPGLIINTGSKQGITTPPGDPAYNVSKAGVKVFTEALQHELR